MAQLPKNISVTIQTPVQEATHTQNMDKEQQCVVVTALWQVEMYGPKVTPGSF